MGISRKMLETPLESAFDFCEVCSVMDADVENQLTLAEARYKCQYCKFRVGGGGIYKFDAIYTAITERRKRVKLEATAGRGEVTEKRYGRVIKAMSEEGKSQRKIARAIGISPTSVNKCLQRMRKGESVTK